MSKPRTNFKDISQNFAKLSMNIFGRIYKIVEIQEFFNDYNDCVYLGFSTFLYTIYDFIRGSNELKPYPELKEKEIQAFGPPEIQ